METQPLSQKPPFKPLPLRLLFLLGGLIFLVFLADLRSTINDLKVLRPLMLSPDPALMAQGDRELVAHEKRDILFDVLGASLSLVGLIYVFFSNRDLKLILRKEQTTLERLTFFDELTDETILVHDQGIIVDVNRAITRLLGYEREEMVGHHLDEFMDPDTGQQTQDRIRQGYPERSYEIMAKAKDGTLYPILVHGWEFTYQGRKVRASSGWDLREWKKTLAELDENRERFERFVEIMREGVLIHENGSFVDANQRFLEMTGAAIGELVGTSGFQFLDGPSVEKVKGFLRSGFPDHSYELVMKNKKGGLVPVEVLGREFDYSGRKYRIASFWDITERKRAEEALRRSEENARNLVEKSPDAVIIHDRERIQYANPAFLRMAGYGGAGEVIGKGLAVLIPPEERKAINQRLDNLLKVGDANPPAERLILRKDGSRMSIEAISFTTFFEGKQAVAVAMRDLTEKKASEENVRKIEERFKRVYENSPIGIALIDLDTRILSANLKFCSILGYPPGGLDGKTIGEITHPGDLENDRDQARRIFAGEIESYQVQKRYFHRDGRVVWGHLTATVVRDPSGRILYGLGMVEDITEAKKTQEMLMKFERLSTIGEMAAGIAHEIRNPLASISAAAQLMKRRESGKTPNTEYLETILEQTKRLDQLILDTLSFARTEQKVEKESVSLKGALEAALRLCQVQFGPTHSKVRVDWDPATADVHVFVNYQRVQQILINLILNAYQVMPEGGAMSLSLWKEGPWALVRVKDTGPGIRPEDRNRIFEPFFTTKTSGSGLGLAISQKVAEQHGGKIEMECLEPRGTAFTLRLPLDKKGTA